MFRAWTTAAAIRHWLAPGDYRVMHAELDLRVGGSYRVHILSPDGVENRVAGVYREITQPSRLVFTWRWETTPGDPETLVTVELTERSGHTEMVLTQEGFTAAERREHHIAGWTAAFDKLEKAATMTYTESER